MTAVRPGGVLSALVEALLPAPCVHCGTPLLGADRGLCEACLRTMVAVVGPQCPRCGAPVDDPGECVNCVRRPPGVAATVIWGEYDGVLRTAILAMKHHGHDELARPLGRRLAARMAVEPWSGDIATVCWVPSHPLRRIRRGRSAAYQLARTVAAEFDLPMRAGLRRSGWRRQAGSTRSTRLALPLRTFSGRVWRECARPVLLVDDVTTTGATLDRAAGALRRCGATAVFAAVMARTPDHRRPT